MPYFALARERDFRTLAASTTQLVHGFPSGESVRAEPVIVMRRSAVRSKNTPKGAGCRANENSAFKQPVDML